MVLRIGTVLIAMALAAPVLAQERPTPPTPEQLAARFDAGDKNKDAKLTRAEFAAQLPPRVSQQAAFLDKIWGNLDPQAKGWITKEEFLANHHKNRMGALRPQ